jgi:nitroreductase
MNTQPWEFAVVSGSVLDNIRQGNLEMLNSGVKSHEERTGEVYGGVYRQRQIDLAVRIFKLMDIAREDKEKRQAWLQRGFRFFDAPAAILITMDKSIEGTWSVFDIGAISQTICLAAMKYGLGTCIESQGVRYPQVIQKYTGLPSDKKIIIGIAIGYPNWDFPANNLETGRDGIEQLTTWHGFAE